MVKAGLVTLTFGGQGLPVATVLLNSLFITSSATSAFPVDAFSTPSFHNQYGKPLGLFFLLYPMLVCFSTRSSALKYIPTCHKGKKFPGMNDKERMSRSEN